MPKRSCDEWVASEERVHGVWKRYMGGEARISAFLDASREANLRRIAAAAKRALSSGGGEMHATEKVYSETH